MRVGSLFSGYGGLDMAVGGEVVWYSEIESAACKVLAAHHPGVPNLGDIKKVDWSTVAPVDVITGGYPCQPFSNAGLRKGKDDERHLWPYVKDAISALRPRLAVLENVRGHLSMGLADVIGDLAGLGYDARWGLVRASDAGAPHSRARVFIVAYPAVRGSQGPGPSSALSGWQATDRFASESSRSDAANAAGEGLQGSTTRRSARSGADQPAAGGASAADAFDDGLQHAGIRMGAQSGSPAAARHQCATADSDSSSSEAWIDPGHHSTRLWVEPVGSSASTANPAGGTREGSSNQGSAGSAWGCEQLGECPDASGVTGHSDGEDDRTLAALSEQRQEPSGVGAVTWGQFGPAIERWEFVLGRRAASPSVLGPNGKARLNPAFVEWMMGLPEGHVTGHGLSTAQELKMLGNGVCPQQARLALQMLGVA